MSKLNIQNYKQKLVRKKHKKKREREREREIVV